jgi:hypothetical protein
MPIKVIVLDDTAKANVPAAAPSYCASGSIDWKRYNWLTNELQQGQDAGQLMILAAHAPINPQQDLYDTNLAPQFDTNCVPPETSTPLSCQSDAQLIATLHFSGWGGRVGRAAGSGCGFRHGWVSWDRDC